MLERRSEGYSGSPFAFPAFFFFRSRFDLLRLAVPPLPRPTSILAAGLHNLVLHVYSV